MRDYFEKVENILRNNPKTRDNDFVLWVAMIEEVEPFATNLITLNDLADPEVLKRFPSYDSVSRTRRKVQSMIPELRGTRRSERMEEAEMMSSRYRELLDLCLYEEEENELYWKTLKDLFSIFKEEVSEDFYDSFEDFFEDYIYNPTEFIIKNSNLKYGEDTFNIFNLPNYYTTDYLELQGLGEVQNVESLNLDFSNELLFLLFTSHETISVLSSYTFGRLLYGCLGILELINLTCG